MPWIDRQQGYNGHIFYLITRSAEERSRLQSYLKDKGIYAVNFGGGQVDITSGRFVFSLSEAYEIKNGKLGRPLKGATLIGDGPTAMRQIRAIGNDMALDPGMGNCGKAGQWVPVGVGQPTTLIGGLTVGGSAAALSEIWGSIQQGAGAMERLLLDVAHESAPPLDAAERELLLSKVDGLLASPAWVDRARGCRIAGLAGYREAAGLLKERATGDLPIVFLEPSCWSMFVDEYRQLELDGADRVAARCVMIRRLLRWNETRHHHERRDPMKTILLTFLCGLCAPAVQGLQCRDDRTGARTQAAADRQTLGQPDPQWANFHAALAGRLLVGPAAGHDDIVFGVGRQVLGERAVHLQSPAGTGVASRNRCHLHQVPQQGSVEWRQRQAERVEADRQVADRGRGVNGQ